MTFYILLEDCSHLGVTVAMEVIGQAFPCQAPQAPAHCLSRCTRGPAVSLREDRLPSQLQTCRVLGLGPDGWFHPT